MKMTLAERFTQTDPAPIGAGSAFESAYVYAGNSPLVFTDPSGLRKKSVGTSNPVANSTPVQYGSKSLRPGSANYCRGLYEKDFADYEDFVAGGTWRKVATLKGVAALTTTCVDAPMGSLFVRASRMVRVRVLPRLPNSAGGASINYRNFTGQAMALPGNFVVGVGSKIIGDPRRIPLSMPGRGAGIVIFYSSSLSGGDVGLNGETDVPKSGEGGSLIPDAFRDQANFDIEVKE